MTTPNVLVLRASGTNCDEETAATFETCGARAEAVHVRRLIEEPELLKKFSILALPGGFSYGDDLGSGVVLAHELRQRLFEPLQDFVKRGGLVLGICNGFQTLIKTGLLPGPTYAKGVEPLVATLTHNDCQHYVDRWVTLRVEKSSSPFLKGAEGRLIECPVAHGEGKFIAKDANVLKKFASAGQIAFRYVTSEGQPADSFPDNPNGSAEAIAGLTDETGRVLGLMPHPERHAQPWQHPRWTRDGLKAEGDGLFIFRNAVEFAKGA